MPSSAPKLRAQALRLLAPASVHAQTYVRPRSTGKRERASEDTRRRHTPWCQGRLQTCVLRPCVSECLHPRGRLRVHGLRVQRPHLRCAGGRRRTLRNGGYEKTQGVSGRLGAKFGSKTTHSSPVAPSSYVRARADEWASEDTRHRYTPWCQGRLQTYALKPCVSKSLRPRGRLHAHGL